MIIDTHIHLDLNHFNKDLDLVLKRAKERRVDKFIIPAIESNKMKRILEIVEENENIYFSAGQHPNYLEEFDIEAIEKLIAHPKCVAIGECGLDWYRIPKGANKEEIKEKQIKMFEEQILLSIKYKKPLILHSRDTDEDMINTLMKYKDSLCGGVIHCYVGSNKLLELLKYGFYFGIGGVLTYANAKELKMNLKKIPLNRIVLETDGPFLTPSGANEKRNEPSFIPLIIKSMSNILGKDIKDIEEQTYKNSLKLFGIN